MTYNEAETRYFLIDPVLREKGCDDYQCMKMAGISLESNGTSVTTT